MEIVSALFTIIVWEKANLGKTITDTPKKIESNFLPKSVIKWQNRERMLNKKEDFPNGFAKAPNRCFILQIQGFPGFIFGDLSLLNFPINANCRNTEWKPDKPKQE